MTEVVQDDFLAMDPSVSKGGAVTKYEKPPILPKGKDQVWPILARLIVNRTGAEAKHYHECHDHQLEVNGKWITVPCYKSKGQKCPFCEAYWGSRKNAETLKGKGAEAEGASDELRIALKKQQLTMKMMEQRRRYGFLVALPKDPTVYMFFAGPALLKAIYGDSEKRKSGAYQELKDGYKIPPYQIDEVAGWILLNKTGQKLETVYSAKPATTEVIEGRVKTEKLMEEPVHAGVKEKAANGTLPRVKEWFDSRFWSLEEMENFIASQFTQLPERFNYLFAEKEGQKVATENPKVETTNFELDELDAPAF
jgi:hypothetical protein